MKRIVATAFTVVLLLAALVGCRQVAPDPVVPTPDPILDPDIPAVVPEIKWIVQPSFSYDTIRVLSDADGDLPQNDRYLAFRAEDRWGLVDLDLNIVVPAVSSSEPFFCSYGELHLSASEPELSSLHVSAGDIVLAQGGHGAFYSEYVFVESEGTAYVLTGDTGLELIPFDQYQGTIPDIVPVAYIEYLYDEQYGWGLEVTHTGAYGYCDNSGALLSTIEYEYACAFSGGFSAAQRGGAWGYIDTSLQPITTFSYRGCHGIFYNEDGTFITDFYPYPAQDGYLVVRTQDGKYGVLDSSGQEVLPCTFDNIIPIPDGRIVILQDHLWGIAALA